MKAIPTFYKGREYRSRLEARWQVFFDELGMKAFYEPYKVSANDLDYTPDFVVLPGRGFGGKKTVHIEIKPIAPNEQYLDYLRKVHDRNDAMVLVCVGAPTLDQPNGFQIHGSEYEHKKTTHGFNCKRCPVCTMYEISMKSDSGLIYMPHYHDVVTTDHDIAVLQAEAYRFDLFPTGVDTEIPSASRQ